MFFKTLTMSLMKKENILTVINNLHKGDQIKTFIKLLICSFHILQFKYGLVKKKVSWMKAIRPIDSNLFYS